MKIIFTFDTFASTPTHQFLFEEISFLRLQGIDARILTLRKEDPNDTIALTPAFTRESFLSLPVAHYWSFGSWKKVTEYLKKEQPDLVITTGSRADVVGRISARLAKVKKIFVFAHSEGEVFARNKNVDSLLSFMTTEYLVSSENAKMEMLARGIFEKKITVLRDGISFEKYGKASPVDIRRNLDIAPEEFVFVYADILEAEKGVDVLLRAFTKVPTGKLLIVGEGSEKKNLETLSKNLGLTERVKFLGNYFDTPGLLTVSNAFVFPSKKEEFALALIAGLLSGLPVITSDFDGVDEIITNGVNGLIVRKQDSEVLAEAMKTLSADTELYEKLRANTKANLGKFSLSSHAAKLLALAQEK